MTTLHEAALELRESDPEFAATLYLLGTPLIADRCQRYVNLARRQIDWTQLRKDVRPWSDGEKLLVSAALDMWNGDGHTKLDQLLYTLDETNMLRVVEAIGIRRRERLGAAPRPQSKLGRLAEGLGLGLTEVPSPPGDAPWEGHDSVRPAFDDDIVVGVRLRPTTLATLRAGHQVRHQRLDRVPGEIGIYDLYVETADDISDAGALPAWEAPHSPGFGGAA